MTDIKKSTAVDYLVRKEYVSGDKAIIDSGVLFSFDGSPIEIKELFNSGFCITIRFTFKTDQENKDNYNLKTNVDINTNISTAAAKTARRLRQLKRTGRIKAPESICRLL